MKTAAETMIGRELFLVIALSFFMQKNLIVPASEKNKKLLLSIYFFKFVHRQRVVNVSL